MDIIESIGNLEARDYVVFGVVGILVFIRAWSILWVTKDISLRSDSFLLQVFSILLVALLTPIVGLPLYILLRPVNLKYDNNGWRDAILVNTVICYECSNFNLKDHNYCIYCGHYLHNKCKECKNNFPKTYEYCNNCGAPNLEVE